jgi:undecaprenyl-diphosphatase
MVGPDSGSAGPVNRGLLVVMTIAGVAVVVLLALTFARHRPIGLDDWGEHRDPIGQPWHSLAKGLDALGRMPWAGLVVLAGVLLCTALRRPGAGVLIGVCSISSAGFTEILKPLVGRRIHHYYLCFPSGHTAFATGWALAIGLVFAQVRGWGPARSRRLVPGFALAAGSLMGWAEVALNAHYVTDALGGAATAFAVVPALALTLDLLSDRSKRFAKSI